MWILKLLRKMQGKMKGFYNLCKICDGVWCSGSAGMVRNWNRRIFLKLIFKIEKYKVVMRTIHDATDPILTTNLWEKNFISMPWSSITGTKFNMGGSYRRRILS